MARRIGRRARRPVLSPCFRPDLVVLERRDAPAVLTVTTLADSGPGSLRAEIDLAQNGDAIVFAANVRGTIALTTGELVLQKQLTIQGPGAGDLTISGSHLVRVFEVTWQKSVTIAGLTIADGTTSQDIGPTTALGSTGGSGGGINNSGYLTVNSCVFAGNTAGTYAGGAVYNIMDLTVNNCSFTGNAAPTGGAIFNDGDGFVDAVVQVANSTFAGNAAFSDQWGGGAIFTTALSTLVVSRSTFSGNTAVGEGGALFGVGTEQLLACTFSGNYAVNLGGAVYNQGALTVATCTVAGNTAGNLGGGIYEETVLGGGGSFATVTLSDTIVAGNLRASGTRDDFHGPVNVGDHNLIGDGSNSIGLLGLAGNRVGTDTQPIDPLLGPLAFNGGPTMTRKLLPGSPALNAGGPAALSGTDQRGEPRTAKALLDIGACGCGLAQTRHVYAVATGPGGGQVNVYGANGALRFILNPYPGFLGGVQVLVGDAIGDGKDYVVTAPGPGGTPEVHVYDGTTGALVAAFNAYDPRFTGGITLALGDTLGLGAENIITAPGRGGTPEVHVFTGRGDLLRAYNAYDPAFTGGIAIAAGDTQGLGYANVITVPKRGGTPEVRVFDGRSADLLTDFNAYDVRFTGGLTLAAGDTTGQGHADIVTAPGAGGTPEVHVYDGLTGVLTRSFNAYSPSFTGGIQVVVADVLGLGRASLVAAPGPGGIPEVRVFDPANLAVVNTVGVPVRDFAAFDLNRTQGLALVARDTFDQGYAGLIVGTGPGTTANVRVFDEATQVLQQDFTAFDPAFLGGSFLG